MNITEKLLEARKMIKETAIQKEGQNGFTKFSYFTPSQVSELVNNVCQDLKMLPIFSLKKDVEGLYGELNIIDIEASKLIPEKDALNGEWFTREGHGIKTQMRTEKPEMKGVNATQMMGSCDTYTKRYMLMSAFDITDNNLDPDSQDNTKPPQSAPNAQTIDIGIEILSCTKQAQLNNLWGKLDKHEKETYLEAFTNQKNKIK